MHRGLPHSLVLLVVNIVSCTIERFPQKWRNLPKSDDDIDVSIIDKLSRNERIECDEDKASLKQGILSVLKKKKYSVNIKETDDGFSISAWRGIIGRFGSDITHVSLLVILLGAIIGSYWGYKDFKAIVVGGSIEVPGEDFSLRLDRFWIDYYDTGQIRQYNSQLAVIEDGEEVLAKQIWVNEPLLYKGIRFYQSSWGVAWDRVSEAEITLTKNGRPVGSAVTAMWKELTDIAGSPYQAKVVAYVSDFAFDPVSKTIFSKSGDVNNPAVNIEVYRDGDMVSKAWLFLYHHGVMKATPENDDVFDFQLTGIRNVRYSGISINKDPGTNVVWAGCIIMGIGFYFAFFIFHRRVWVDVSSGGQSSVIRIGGMINKNELIFDKEFKELVDKIRAISKGSSSEGS